MGILSSEFRSIPARQTRKSILLLLNYHPHLLRRSRYTEQGQSDCMLYPRPTHSTRLFLHKMHTQTPSERTRFSGLVATSLIPNGACLTHGSASAAVPSRAPWEHFIPNVSATWSMFAIKSTPSNSRRDGYDGSWAILGNVRSCGDIELFPHENCL